MSVNLDHSDLRQKIASLPWFHEIDLGDGLITPGRTKLSTLRMLADLYFDEPLIGKSFLDIGCYDGFNSFEAYRRGAKRVLATDHFIWHHDPRSREAFELARRRICPGLQAMDIDVMDLTTETVGTFDVVLFAGVLYHLRHPFLTIERVARLTAETLILESHLDALELTRPAMIFYPTDELNNDPTNWWGPNPACIEAMLRDVGFSIITYKSYLPNRGVFHARKGGER